MTVLVFLPPLRHFVTPLLKERFFVRLPLRGAVDAVDCGCFLMLFLFATTPSLRDTSPQGEAFVWLPLRSAGGVAVCGVALFSILSYLLLGRPMIAPTNIKFCVRNGALDIPFFVPYPNAPRISVGATIGRPIALTLRGSRQRS